VPKSSGGRAISSCMRTCGSHGREMRSLITGHCRRCSAGVVWLLGIVEMFADHVPKPFKGSGGALCGPALVVLRRLRPPISSGPVDAVLLVAGEIGPPSCPPALVGVVSFDCSSPSIRDSCSKISLSPASSLIPGSRYTQSALSSEQSRHFGLAPSQRDFLLLQISHAIVARRRG